MQTLDSSDTAQLVQPPLANAPKCRVLAIDDNPDMINLLKAYLSDPRISVTIAENGGEGIACFRNGAFDLVIMDILMSDMDGYTATRLIRAWEAEHGLPRTPIVALTAISEFGDSYRILSAGCTLHLTKPINRSTLLQVVNQFGSAKKSSHSPHAAAADPAGKSAVSSVRKSG